jgi:hypothetical protein
MVDHSSASTMSLQNLAIKIMDTARTSRSCSRHGIDLILLSMRLSSPSPSQMLDANILLQQVLYGLIQQIALQFPAGSVRDQYVTAAANFRIPYWDWAAVPPPEESVFPNSVGGSPSILVDGPAGSQTIANPLWSYQFKPLDPSQLPDPPVSPSLLFLNQNAHFLPCNGPSF